MCGCLGVFLALILVLVLLPLLPAVIALYVLYLLGRLVFRRWRSNRRRETRRNVKGSVLFLVLAGAFLVGVIMTHPVALMFPLLALFAVVALLLLSGPKGQTRQFATVAVTPAGGLAQRTELPTSELRSLLEVEESRSADERKLLLVREFSRLVGEACGPGPLDRESWPDWTRLQVLAQEVALLQASARESPLALPVPGAATSDYRDLVDALRSLRSYVDLMASLRAESRPSPEGLRVLARDRGRLLEYQDTLLEHLDEPRTGT